MERERILVVAAVIRRDDRFLAGLRPELKRHGGMWEFPGGKLDSGESMLDAARRELWEELSLEVVALGDTLFHAQEVDAPFEIHFVEVEVVGTPQLHEHSEIGWFTLDEMAEMSLTPADARFVAHISPR